MAAIQKNQLFDPGSYSLLQTVLANTYRFATIENVTDNRQTPDRQTNRQMKQCAKGITKLETPMALKIEMMKASRRMRNGEGYPSQLTRESGAVIELYHNL